MVKSSGYQFGRGSLPYFQIPLGGHINQNISIILGVGFVGHIGSGTQPHTRGLLEHQLRCLMQGFMARYQQEVLQEEQLT